MGTVNMIWVQYNWLSVWKCWCVCTVVTLVVITWASASSLKALTRESSFSLSSAHWERNREGDFHYPHCFLSHFKITRVRCKFGHAVRITLKSSLCEAAATPQTSVKAILALIWCSWDFYLETCEASMLLRSIWKKAGKSEGGSLKDFS